LLIAALALFGRPRIGRPMAVTMAVTIPRSTGTTS